MVVLAGAAVGVPAVAVPAAAAAGALTVTTADSALLGHAQPRLVFSTRASAAVPAREITFRNTGSAAVTVKALRLSGPDATSFALAAPAPLTVPAGATRTVAVRFTPTAPTGCATGSNQSAVADIERVATLTWRSDAGTSGRVALGGLNACGAEGYNEPTLAQIFHGLGFTTRVTPGPDARKLGARRTPTSPDEVAVPRFVPADPAEPVQVIAAAHYGTRVTTSGGYGAVGWYPATSAPPTPCPATAGCRELWRFAPDTASTYTENQALLPLPDAATEFRPDGPFGVWQGDGSELVFTDDARSIALDAAGAVIDPPHYLHGMRAYRAYGPGRTPLPDTWLLGVDLGRVPASKNNDYQDVVLLVRNAVPAAAAGARPGSPRVTRDLTAAKERRLTSCAVGSFTGALPSSGTTACAPGALRIGPAGLAVPASPGQLGGRGGAQENALATRFDASRQPFTVTARVAGPLDYLTEDYQQVAAWFGPDEDNYVKVEAEHAGDGPPRITMYYEEGGVGGTVRSVPVPELATARSVDLVISGDASVPDPSKATTLVWGYPLGELTVSYSVDGQAPVKLDAVRRPADVGRWFATDARAGVLASRAGSSIPFTATFAAFAVR